MELEFGVPSVPGPAWPTSLSVSSVLIHPLPVGPSLPACVSKSFLTKYQELAFVYDLWIK